MMPTSILKNVTVFVAVLNKKDTIKNCVDSLLKLDPAPARIMIIDGYSKDGTYEILEQYKDKLDLFQFPEGLSATLNWGLDRIDTELTAMTDGDCRVAPDWLAELVKGFAEEGVIATAGHCGTPQGLSFLQTIIGLEVENRWNRSPKYINRAPEMNLCLKTEVAKKVRFNEKQMVAVDSDFGYRLTKLGKMTYNPAAKVFHYHRSSLKGFYKQQKNFAKWHLRILMQHGSKTISDHMSTPSMTLQVPVFSLGLLFFLASVFSKSFLYPALAFFLILLAIYFKNIIEIKPPLSYYPALLGLFALRTVSWIMGIAEALLLFPVVLRK
ncbi:MAG: glycosyltransferase [bacterium]|nr:glycosyltransferase [bacterium]